MKNKIIITLTITLIILISTLGLLLIYINSLPKCPEGYTTNGDKCSKIITTDANKTLFCEEGYELDNGICKKTETLNANKKYSCVKYDNSEYITVSNPTLTGTKCKYTFYHEPVERLNCPNGCYLNNSTECVCRFIIPATVMGTGDNQRLVCINGYLEGTNCIFYTYPTPTTTKHCIDGFSLINNTCQETIYENAAVNISCPNGYILNGNYCEKTLTQEPNIKYECYEDYRLIEKKCQKEIFVDKIR